MRRRFLLVCVLTLSIAVGLLGVRLYQTTQRLEKAEQYMVSGLIAWLSLCGSVALDLASSDLGVHLGAVNRVKNHCVTPEDEPGLDALLEQNDRREAVGYVVRRLYLYRFPRVLKRGSYDSSTFPAGYP
jgi:hypothetical protein